MRSYLLVAAATALFATTTTAQQRTSLDAAVLAKIVRQYDKNGDGKVQKDEYPRTDEAFASLDRDGDGVIDDKDMQAPPRRSQRKPRDRPRPAPVVGDVAPDFDLPMLGMKDTTVKLSSFRGVKPVALIFGSYT
jgi:hypothetical protein